MTESDILTALKTLAGEGQQVYEIVVDGNKAKTFKDLESAAAFAYKASQKPTTRAVYFVFNPIDAEAREEYIKAEKAKGRKAPRTCDAVISSRRWIVFDFDPVRPVGVNSTDAEKAKALEVAEQVKRYLVDYCWSAPIEIDSGNGIHLYYSADLDNSPESRIAVKALTDSISAKFSTGAVIVDRTVFKPSQLMRLPGTMNRKGESTDERPQREVTILSKPEEAQEPIRLRDIIEIVGEAETKSLPNEAEGNQLDVDAYANSTGLELLKVDPIDRISPEGKGFTVYPVVCPFDSSHTKGEAALTVGTNGAIGFNCKHHSCADNKWTEVKELLGSPTVDHYPQPTAQDEFDAIEIPEESVLDMPTGKGFRFNPRSAGEMMTLSKKPKRPCIVEGIFRRRDVVNIVAAPKVGKSWLALGLAFAVARGEPWLGFKTTRGRVLMIDNEIESSDFSERMADVAKPMGFSLDSISQWLDVENLRDKGEDEGGGYVPNILEMREFLKKRFSPGTYDLIILDALYRFMPPRMSENDNGDMTRIYNELDRIAQQTGAAIVVVHHTSKGDQSRKSSTDVGSGAGSISRCADCHLIIRPHEVDRLAVLEADLRHHKDFDKFSIELDWPIWKRSDEVPALKVPKSAKETKQEMKDQEDLNTIASLLDEGPKTAWDIRRKNGWGDQKTNRLLALGGRTGAFAVESVKSQKGTDQLVARRLEVVDDFENVRENV